MIFDVERGYITGELTERFNFTGKQDHDYISKWYPEGHKWLELAVSDEDAKELEFFGCKVRTYTDRNDEEYKAVRITLFDGRRIILVNEDSGRRCNIDVDQSSILETFDESITKIEATVHLIRTKYSSSLAAVSMIVHVSEEVMDQLADMVKNGELESI